MTDSENIIIPFNSLKFLRHYQEFLQTFRDSPNVSVSSSEKEKDKLSIFGDFSRKLPQTLN